MNKPRLLLASQKKGQNLNIFYYSEKYIKEDLKIRGGGRKKICCNGLFLLLLLLFCVLIPEKMEFLSLPRTIRQNPCWICSPLDFTSSNKGKLVTFSHCRRFLIIGKSQIQKPITCARKGRRRNGSSRSAKLVIESAYQIASRLRIIPEPLDLLIKELGNVGGNGGGFWIPNGGSGWGGFDGWGNGRRRRRRSNRKIAIFIVAVILGLGIWMILGKEFKTDVFLKVLGFMVLGLSVYRWNNTRFRDWALGFSSCAALGSLAMKKEDFQKLMNNFEGLKVSFRRRTKRPF